MENQDLDLIQKLAGENEELATLWREHLTLENQLEALSQRVFLTPQEQLEVKRLKKVKLAGRDRIEAILAEYRSQNA